MTKAELIKEIEGTADYARAQGDTIEINYRLPYVAVDLVGGYSYFFQGEEASDLLDECPDYVNEEDYILWVAQGW